MAGRMARVPMSHRLLKFHAPMIEYSGDLPMTLSDTIFGFLDEEGDRSSPESIIYNENEDQNYEDDEERQNSYSNVDDNKSFWENQHQLLQGTLYRTSSLESKIRNCTKEALREAQTAGNVCTCQRPVYGGCRNCLMQQVSSCLQNAGFNSAICKSKWKTSPNIPSGEHTFIDVLDHSNPKKGEVRIIIELNFRGEFEMAKANEEYNALVNKLPEVFVGKVERLLSLITILCTGAKKCMKDKKMHMGPWRKQRYMQAKWLRVSERRAALSRPLATTGYSGRPRRPRASMLTVDMLDKLPSLHCAAVEVV